MPVIRTYVLSNSHVDNWSETANQHNSTTVVSKHIGWEKDFKGGERIFKGNPVLFKQSERFMNPRLLHWTDDDAFKVN